MSLKAIILGLSGVFLKDEGTPDVVIVKQLKRLLEYINSKGVKAILLSNRDWTFTHTKTSTKYSLQEYINKIYGKHEVIVTTKMGIPRKPQKDAVDTILARNGLRQSEVIYIGNSLIDFRTAINSKVLFLNAIWYGKVVDYGFIFDSPDKIAKFIEIFGLKKHPWHYSIDSPITYRSLAPFSTLKTDYRAYSTAAREAAKLNTPERLFFLNSVVAALYFSEIVNRINYIACVPSHSAGFGNAVMNDVLTIFGKCFRINYIPNLIVRHTTSPKSQFVRIRGQRPLPISQLNTIHLVRRPLKTQDKPYTNDLALRNKCVLVIDDFCTAGYSLEATRIYLENVGATVILVSWLKTINVDYEVLSTTKRFESYVPNIFKSTDINVRRISYVSGIIDKIAPTELLNALDKYKTWTMP